MNKKRISLVLLIIWMIIIFIMSSFDADASSSQSGLIVNFISSIFNIKNIELLSFIVRKLAHFMEYFILGILFVRVIINYNKKIYLAYIFGIMYACLDEFHQLFVSGRSGQIFDIFVDCTGLILGIIITNIILKNRV